MSPDRKATASWVRTVKWAVFALVAAPPLYLVLGTALRDDAEVGGFGLLLLTLLLIPAFFYGIGVSSKWGVLVVGVPLVALTARTWLVFQSSDPHESLNGLIPITGLVPAAGIALAGAVADLAYRFFRKSSA